MPAACHVAFDAAIGGRRLLDVNGISIGGAVILTTVLFNGRAFLLSVLRRPFGAEFAQKGIRSLRTFQGLPSIAREGRVQIAQIVEGGFASTKPDGFTLIGLTQRLADGLQLVDLFGHRPHFGHQRVCMLKAPLAVFGDGLAEFFVTLLG